MTTPRPAAVRAAAVAVTALALSAAPQGAADSTAVPSRYVAAAPAGSAVSGSAGYCKDDTGVTVVVDMSALGGGVTVRCAGDSGAGFSGLDALRAAGFAVTGTTRFGLSFVCRIQGRPAADEVLAISGNDEYRERCLDTPPPTAFWGYWYASNRGAWTYSSSGAQAHDTIPGGFEGWSFALGEGSPQRPAILPVRPTSPPSSSAPPPTTASPPTTVPPPTTRPPAPSGPPSPTRTPQPTQTAPSPAPSDPTQTPPATSPPNTRSGASEHPPASAKGSTPRASATSSSSGAGAGKGGPPRTASARATADPQLADKQRAGAPRTAATDQVQVSGELPAAVSEDAGSPWATAVGAGVLVLIAGGVGLTAWRRSHRV